MADLKKFEDMLERLINEDKEGAEELFHEIVVEKSREIYENILESDLEDEEVDEATDEEVDESDEDLEESDDEEVDESDDEDLDEGFDLDEFEVEADPMDMDMGGDAGDDMEMDIEMPAADDMDDMEDGMDDMEGDMEDRIEDLEDALEDLKAEFDAMMGDEEGDDMDDEEEPEMDDEGDDMDDEEPEEEAIAFESDDEEVDEGSYKKKKEKKTAGETMREYVEKIGAWEDAKGGDEGKGVAGNNHGTSISNTNTKSAVAGKNDMGGTASNLNQSKDEKGTEAGKGAIQGSSLADTSAKPMNTKNVNEPGSKTATKMNAVSGGHGAETKGKPETADKGAQSTLNKVSSRAK